MLSGGWKRCLRGPLWTFTRKISTHVHILQRAKSPSFQSYLAVGIFRPTKVHVEAFHLAPYPQTSSRPFQPPFSQAGSSAKCRCMGLVFVDPFHFSLLTHTTASAVEPFVLEQQPQESAQQQQRHIPAAVAAPAASAWTSLVPWVRV